MYDGHRCYPLSHVFNMVIRFINLGYACTMVTDVLTVVTDVLTMLCDHNGYITILDILVMYVMNELNSCVKNA